MVACVDECVGIIGICGHVYTINEGGFFFNISDMTCSSSVCGFCCCGCCCCFAI